MSDRFSLRFPGLSACRLLGLAICEDTGRDDVVAMVSGQAVDLVRVGVSVCVPSD